MFYDTNIHGNHAAREGSILVLFPLLVHSLNSMLYCCTCNSINLFLSLSRKYLVYRGSSASETNYLDCTLNNVLLQLNNKTAGMISYYGRYYCTT